LRRSLRALLLHQFRFRTNLVLRETPLASHRMSGIMMTTDPMEKIKKGRVVNLERLQTGKVSGKTPKRCWRT